MDVYYELNDASFVWNDLKAKNNPGKHGGVTFQQAATVFFDPLFRLVDAERKDEARDAIVGFDAVGRLLFVVHIQLESEFIRIISARPATQKERRDHEHS